MNMNTTEKRKIEFLKAHLAINVKNVETSIEFYKKMFGIEPSKVRTGYAKFDVQNPPLNFTLNQVPFDSQGALSHMGIQVASTEDVLAMREQWHEAGLITRDEMQTNCCYATQDKTWVHDPDGNEWEAFVVLQDNLPEASEHGYSACCVVAETTEQPIELDASCACETAPPAEGEAACCDTQAVKFGIETVAETNAASCCAPAPVRIGR
jgi:catechol 2,3-dioxygenase-like lactoylglutathione lyase family enzyme